EYNELFQPDTLLGTPLLQELEGIDLGDPFLNFSGLIHLEEPWVVDKPTQQGIKAYISIFWCTEELFQSAKETGHMMNWVVQYHRNVNNLCE
ncbi:hypothetical protein DFH28DRAFT_848596, partial [Melampsora americana]